jgi:hypothetical protein
MVGQYYSDYRPIQKLLIGGAFTSYNGVGRNNIAGINFNGSLDTGFNPGAGANNVVFAFGPIYGGKALVGGVFTTYNGVSRPRLAQIFAGGGSSDPALMLLLSN